MAQISQGPIYSDIIIIGGGAAGLMAAVGAPGALVIEKMPRAGRKIVITGKGRCNFTNVKNWQEFSTHIHPKANCLRPAFYNLPPEKLIELFEQNGMPCVVERGQRAFPESHVAMDVVDCLVRMVRKAGSRIEYGCEVQQIKVKDACSVNGGRFEVVASGGKVFQCRRLIITCGGLSYPGTGSTGDGYRFAVELGHKVTRLFPSLTALVPKAYKVVDSGTDGKHIHRDTALGSVGRQYCGRSMKNVGIELFIDSQSAQSEFGDIDFTDGGLEGPIGYKISRKAVNALDNGGKVEVVISFGKDDKPLRFSIVGYVGYERAVVTAGGVLTDEIIPKTMESRIVSGIHFAGEVLDIDADTGGYNLQCAFCTGYLAGQSAFAALKQTTCAPED